MRWVLKTSSVRVATAEHEQVYRSLEDVPTDLQKEIRKTLEGPNSDTIYIANQEAYERIKELTHELPGKITVSEEKPPAPKGLAELVARRWWIVLAAGCSALAVFSLLWRILDGA
jgi:ferric-dicitrate binding protein FerR (iron transport regulator)